MFSCNLPSALSAKQPGSFTYQNKSAQKVDYGKENSPSAPAETQTRDHMDHEPAALTSELYPSPVHRNQRRQISRAGIKQFGTVRRKERLSDNSCVF